MAKVVPNKTHKADRRPTCKHCKTRFRTTSATAMYCNRSCKEKAAALKKRVNYVSRATDSAFFHMLASECHRAGTLEVLSGHTVESLVELYGVYKYWLRANQYGSVSDYAMSHISPVAGNRTVGRFHAHNIVVAPIHMNRRHSNKHFAHGLSISRASLRDRHTVDKHEPRKTTVARIIRFLGEDIVSEFARIAKVQPTGRHKVLSWLMDHLDPFNPDHAEHLERLHQLSTKALTQLKSQIEGKEPTKPYREPTKEVQVLTIFAEELTRHSAIRPELAPLAAFLTECSQRVEGQELLVIPIEFFQALFNVLHGKSLADEAEHLAPALPQLQALARFSGELPEVSAPICVEHSPKEPAKVLKRFQSFADELDAHLLGDVLSDAPVMLSPHTTTYESDRMPWE